MKKPYILVISITVSFLIFFLLLLVFKGVSHYIAEKYQPQYITPSAKDSLYMELLNDSIARKKVIDLSHEVEQFYFITDSIKTILDAKISPQLISEIIIDKGLAAHVKTELHRLDTSQIISCQPYCLEDIYLNDDKVWLQEFQEKQPKEIRDFVQTKINLVVEAEKQALLKIKMKEF